MMRGLGGTVLWPVQCNGPFLSSSLGFEARPPWLLSLGRERGGHRTLQGERVCKARLWICRTAPDPSPAFRPGSSSLALGFVTWFPCALDSAPTITIRHLYQTQTGEGCLWGLRFAALTAAESRAWCVWAILLSPSVARTLLRPFGQVGWHLFTLRALSQCCPNHNFPIPRCMAPCI